MSIGGLVLPSSLMDRRYRCSLCSPDAAAPIPRAWRFEPIPGGYRVIDANGLPLAHVYGQPPVAVAFSDKRLTDDEARRVSKLISRLPELVEVERDWNKARTASRSHSALSR